MFDQEALRSQAMTKLGTHPPNPDLYRAGFLSTSITPPGELPPPGSTVQKCANCPDPVIIGPQQQQAIQGAPLLVDLAHAGRYSIGPGIPVLCLPCIGALTMIAPDIGVDIAGIGVE